MTSHSKRKALLTGGGGFVGRHMRAFLEAEGVEVFTMGPRDLGEGHRVVGVRDVEGQVRVLEEVRPDFFFHFAGLVSSSVRADVYEVNALYAASLIQAFQEVGLVSCKILFAGSAAEYGRIESGDLPIREEQVCVPFTDYGISKLAQTQMGVAGAEQGLSITVVRTFNLLGPGLGRHLAAGSFVDQLRQMKAGTLDRVMKVGNVRSERDFLDVREAVRCYWGLLQSPCVGEVVNVCSGVGTRIEDVLLGLIDAFGLDVKVEKEAARVRADDIPVHVGSAEKLTKLIGRAPVFNLEGCLSDMVGFEG